MTRGQRRIHRMFRRRLPRHFQKLIHGDLRLIHIHLPAAEPIV